MSSYGRERQSISAVKALLAVRRSRYCVLSQKAANRRGRAANPAGTRGACIGTRITVRHLSADTSSRSRLHREPDRLGAAMADRPLGSARAETGIAERATELRRGRSYFELQSRHAEGVSLDAPKPEHARTDSAGQACIESVRSTADSVPSTAPAIGCGPFRKSRRHHVSSGDRLVGSSQGIQCSSEPSVCRLSLLNADIPTGPPVPLHLHGHFETGKVVHRWPVRLRGAGIDSLQTCAILWTASSVRNMLRIRACHTTPPSSRLGRTIVFADSEGST